MQPCAARPPSCPGPTPRVTDAAGNAWAYKYDIRGWQIDTIVEPGRLITDLEHTMKQGYAVTTEEMTLGTCSVAAPILDRAGRPVAAVVHSVRVDPGKLAPLVRLAAEGIAARVDANARDVADVYRADDRSARADGSRVDPIPQADRRND